MEWQISKGALPKKVAEKCYNRLFSSELTNVIKIKSNVRAAMANFLRDEGFVEISPVILSPITDPLRHETLNGTITYYGHSYALTKSMILHKQMALLSFEKIFSFSPNVRLETVEKKETGKHLFEFTQLDLEMRYASREEVMELAERLLIHVLREVKKACREELSEFGREVRVPSRPFERIQFGEAYERYGNEFEAALSNVAEEPFWIVDFPIWKREFYDKEFEHRPGILKDMDMIYPEGYGEGLSGGEREYEYSKVKERIEASGLDTSLYLPYLEIVKRGIYPSAGFGIGLERLVRFICRLEDVGKAALFPKIPGEYCI